jgi:hypothetical protein
MTRADTGSLIGFRLCSPPGQAGQGRSLRSRRLRRWRKPPPLTVPPCQAVSGSYRMRHLYALAKTPEGAAAMLAEHRRSTTPPHVVSQAASTSPEGQPPGPDTVKAGLTSKRPRRLVENDEYGAFARRVPRAYARQVGEGDVEALALMPGLADRSTPPSPRRSRACAAAATPGPRSAPGSASPARPPSNDGEEGQRGRPARSPW